MNKKRGFILGIQQIPEHLSTNHVAGFHRPTVLSGFVIIISLHRTG
jgi:hypothetical protein